MQKELIFGYFFFRKKSKDRECVEHGEVGDILFIGGLVSSLWKVFFEEYFKSNVGD